jgi:hypothetical protein
LTELCAATAVRQWNELSVHQTAGSSAKAFITVVTSFISKQNIGRKGSYGKGSYRPTPHLQLIAEIQFTLWVTLAGSKNILACW